jgi:uncharacterized protein (DUF433 family)
VKAVKQDNAEACAHVAGLERMIGPDEHRPGPAHARLLAEHIPVWAIIGHLKAVASATDRPINANEVMAQVAAEFDVSLDAVRAALLYYEQHRAAIDALLEANAAALD